MSLDSDVHQLEPRTEFKLIMIMIVTGPSPAVTETGNRYELELEQVTVSGGWQLRCFKCTFSEQFTPPGLRQLDSTVTVTVTPGP